MEYPYSDTISELTPKDKPVQVHVPTQSTGDRFSRGAESLQDDYLLGKIDEFREKAKVLQQLLETKESKVRSFSIS